MKRKGRWTNTRDEDLCLGEEGRGIKNLRGGTRDEEGGHGTTTRNK